MSQSRLRASATWSYIWNLPRYSGKHQMSTKWNGYYNTIDLKEIRTCFLSSANMFADFLNFVTT